MNCVRINYCQVWLTVARFWWGESKDYWILFIVLNLNLYSLSLKKACCWTKKFLFVVYGGAYSPQLMGRHSWETNSGPIDPLWIRCHLCPLIQISGLLPILDYTIPRATSSFATSASSQWKKVTETVHQPIKGHNSEVVHITFTHIPLVRTGLMAPTTAWDYGKYNLCPGNCFLLLSWREEKILVVSQQIWTETLNKGGRFSSQESTIATNPYEGTVLRIYPHQVVHDCITTQQ